MDRKENCESCYQKHGCRQIIEDTGRSGNPPVVTIIITFLLPVAVFIVSLAVFQRFFADILCFVFAALAAFICICITRLVKKALKVKI
jgi:hypothetical protein